MSQTLSCALVCCVGFDSKLLKELRFDTFGKVFDLCLTFLFPDLRPEAVYYGNRSLMYFKLSKMPESLDDAIQSVKLDPKYLKGYLRQSAIYVTQGDPDKAQKVVEEAQMKCTKLSEKEKNDLRQELDRVGKLKGLLEQLNKSLSKNDHRGTVYYSSLLAELCPEALRFKVIKAEGLVQQQKYQEAQSLISDVLRLDSKNPDAIYVRGLTFYYADNLDKAAEHFKQAIKLNPDHKKAASVFKKLKLFKSKKEEGNEAFQSGKIDESIKLYTEAMHIDSSNNLVCAKLYYNRCLAMSKVSPDFFY